MLLVWESKIRGVETQSKRTLYRTLGMIPRSIGAFISSWFPEFNYKINKQAKHQNGPMRALTCNVCARFPVVVDDYYSLDHTDIKIVIFLLLFICCWTHSSLRSLAERSSLDAMQEPFVLCVCSMLYSFLLSKVK